MSATTPQTLHINARHEAPGLMVIRCAGELDLASYGELAEAIDWSYTSDLLTLRIDLTDVTFIDSRGVQCLMDAEDRCSRLATRFEVVSSDAVRRMCASWAWSSTALTDRSDSAPGGGPEHAALPRSAA